MHAACSMLSFSRRKENEERHSDQQACRLVLHVFFRILVRSKLQCWKCFVAKPPDESAGASGMLARPLASALPVTSRRFSDVIFGPDSGQLQEIIDRNVVSKEGCRETCDTWRFIYG
jgi:hypothetical protein